MNPRWHLPILAALAAALLLPSRSRLKGALRSAAVGVLTFLGVWAILSGLHWALWFYGLYALSLAFFIALASFLLGGLVSSLRRLGARGR